MYNHENSDAGGNNIKSGKKNYTFYSAYFMCNFILFA